MRDFTRFVVTSFLLISLSIIAHAQQILFDASAEPRGSPGYQIRWDSQLERMIAYRDISDPNLPAIRVLSNSGEKLSLYPLRDFPGSTYIDIWDVTGAPDGSIVMAAILGYGPRNAKPVPVPVKSFLLTYDKTGTLRRVWEVEPYHHHRVAADAAGNVFALGDGGKGDYPLLIKYSPSGDVLGEFLSSGLFSAKDSVVGMTSPNGQPQLFVTNGLLNVWIAATLELYTFSLDGVLLSVTSLSAAAQNIAELTGGAHVRFLELQVDSSHGIIAQVGLSPKDQKLPAVALAHIKPDGSFDSWIEPPSHRDGHRFMGLTTRDKTVFLEKEHGSAVSVNFNK